MQRNKASVKASDAVQTPRRSPQNGLIAKPATSSKPQNNVIKNLRKSGQSITFSPSNSRHSVLTDNTDIDEPKNQAWWNNLGDNSRDIMEVLQNKENNDISNIIDDYDILSQSNKNQNYDPIESSGSESIGSIRIPQRKLFTHKDPPQNKFSIRRGTSIVMSQKSQNEPDKTIVVAPKQLFNLDKKKWTKPAFPVELLNISNKSIMNKTKEVTEDQKQIKSLFGNQAPVKRKNIFADLIASESEDEISNVEARVFGFHNGPAPKRPPVSMNKEPYSPTSSIASDVDITNWKLLPSSTVVDIIVVQSDDDEEEPSNKQTHVMNNILHKSQYKNTLERDNIDISLEHNFTGDRKTKKLHTDVDKSKQTSILNEHYDKNKIVEGKDEYRNMITNKEVQEQDVLEELQAENENIVEHIFLKYSSKDIDRTDTETNKDDEDKNKSNRSKNIAAEEIEILKDNDIIDTACQGGNEVDMEELDDNNKPKDGNDEDINVSIDASYPNNVNDLVNIVNHKGHKNQKIETEAFQRSISNGRAGSDDNADLAANDGESDMVVDIVANGKEFDINIAINNIESDDGSDGVNMKLHYTDTNKSDNEGPEDLPADNSYTKEDETNMSEHEVDENKSDKTGIVHDSNTKENELHESHIKDEADSPEHEDEAAMSEHEVEADMSEHEDEAAMSEHEVEADMSEHEDEAAMPEHEVEADMSEHEDEAAMSEHEVEADMSEHEDEVDSSEHEVEADMSEHEDEADMSEHEDEADISECQDEGDMSEHQNDDNGFDKDNETLQDNNENSNIDEHMLEFDNDSNIEEQEDQSNENDSADLQSENENINDTHITENNEGSDVISHKSTEENTHNSIEEEVEDSSTSEEEDENNSEEEKKEQQNNTSKDEIVHEESAVDSNEVLQNASRNENNGNAIIKKTFNKSKTDSNTSAIVDNSILPLPEAVLHNETNKTLGITARRNTSVRMTKTLMKNISDIGPILAPNRDSLGGLSNGTNNSSTAGSGWDSHRTTRKTLRQTFGKDFTPRKSLRTLVMEKAAKIHTSVNPSEQEPNANSTEIQTSSNNTCMTDRQATPKLMQTNLDEYLQNMRQNILKRRVNMEVTVKNSIRKPDGNILNNVDLYKTKYKERPPPESRQVQSKKRQVSTHLLSAEMLADLKYKPPKRKYRASWMTKRLYNFLEKKLEPKYDYNAHKRAEKVVDTLLNFSKQIQKADVAPADLVGELKMEMARLHIVTTHFEFYDFFNDYIPKEIRIKVVPDAVNKLRLPATGVFSDIVSRDS